MKSRGQCKACGRFISLTSKGKIWRHGFKSFANNRFMMGFIRESDYSMTELRPPCWGSGIPPRMNTTRETK